eukprot:EG_transcript_15857
MGNVKGRLGPSPPQSPAPHPGYGPQTPQPSGVYRPPGVHLDHHFDDFPPPGQRQRGEYGEPPPGQWGPPVHHSPGGRGRGGPPHPPYPTTEYHPSSPAPPPRPPPYFPGDSHPEEDLWNLGPTAGFPPPRGAKPRQPRPLTNAGYPVPAEPAAEWEGHKYDAPPRARNEVGRYDPWSGKSGYGVGGYDLWDRYAAMIGPNRSAHGYNDYARWNGYGDGYQPGGLYRGSGWAGYPRQFGALSSPTYTASDVIGRRSGAATASDPYAGFPALRVPTYTSPTGPTGNPPQAYRTGFDEGYLAGRNAALGLKAPTYTSGGSPYRGSLWSAAPAPTYTGSYSPSSLFTPGYLSTAYSTSYLGTGYLSNPLGPDY